MKKKVVWMETQVPTQRDPVQIEEVNNKEPNLVCKGHVIRV